MQRRVKISSPYVEEIDMMLLHCSTEGIDTIKSAVIRLDEEISLDNNQKCRYVFLMLIPVDAKDYQREILSSISKKLIEDEELREQIKGAGIGTSATRAEIMKKLERIKYIQIATYNIAPLFYYSCSRLKIL